MDFLTVVCAIIINEDKVLAAQRSETMNLPLKWEFPGGKINGFESEEECLHRELSEELNIRVKVIKRMQNYFHDYGDNRINLIPFITEYSTGDLNLTEHNNAGWFSKPELQLLDWAEADIPVLRDFLSYEI